MRMSGVQGGAVGTSDNCVTRDVGSRGLARNKRHRLWLRLLRKCHPQEHNANDPRVSVKPFRVSASRICSQTYRSRRCTGKDICLAPFDFSGEALDVVVCAGGDGAPSLGSEWGVSVGNDGIAEMRPLILMIDFAHSYSSMVRRG